MGIFDKFRKEKVFQQDLNKKEEHQGMVFIIHLLMEGMCDMPDKQNMQRIMNKHFNEIDCFCHNEKVAGFSPKNYSVHFEKDNKDLNPQLMITECSKIEKPVIDEISASQLWDCENGLDIIE